MVIEKNQKQKNPNKKTNRHIKLHHDLTLNETVLQREKIIVIIFAPSFFIFQNPIISITFISDSNV